jgi:hypothetical protein
MNGKGGKEKQERDYKVGQYIKFRDDFDFSYYGDTVISKNKKYKAIYVTRDWVYIIQNNGTKNGWSRSVIEPYYEDGYLESVIAEIQNTF